MSSAPSSVTSSELRSSPSVTSSALRSSPSATSSEFPASPNASSSEPPPPPSSPKGIARRSSYPLKIWLLAAFFLTIGVTGITSAVVGVWLIGKGISEQAQSKARLDLNSAWLIYYNRLEHMRTTLRLAGMGGQLVEAVQGQHWDVLRTEASGLEKAWGYDYVSILDPKGRVLARANGSTDEQPVLTPLVTAVVGGKSDAVGTLVHDAATLARESPKAAERARIVLRTSDRSAQPPREISSGLVIEGAAAIRDTNGTLIAILRAGALLNHDQETVDIIKTTIFPQDPSDGHTTGGSSLCLGDVRVASSIRTESGERAVGTTVDPIVRHRVLDEDRTLVDRATVLGNSYFTAYQPIRDPVGRAIGILSLGVPERNFALLRYEALAIFIGIVLCGAVVAFILAGLVGRRILYPIEELAATMHSYEKGDMELRMRPFTRTPTELVELGNGLRAMARALRERQLQLKYHTEKQLGKAERLAMIGRLSAGVAHEINNPLGGILLFSSLLLKKADPDGRDHSALERICNEAKRCQQIVQGLLDFARPREPKREQFVLELVVERALQLVIGQSLFHNIQVIKEYAEPKPEGYFDPAQLQQVLLNLIVNAAEAMNGQGVLTLVTQNVENGTAAQIEVADSGCGIAPENLDRLFEPFFTTKEVGRGTGLGLSISRSIVESHHGSIWAESQHGVGTRFFIRLPAFRTKS
jgi:two-component system, NtrC family, sensor kinase